MEIFFWNRTDMRIASESKWRIPAFHYLQSMHAELFLCLITVIWFWFRCMFFCKFLFSFFLFMVLKKSFSRISFLPYFRSKSNQNSANWIKIYLKQNKMNNNRNDNVYLIIFDLCFKRKEYFVSLLFLLCSFLQAQAYLKSNIYFYIFYFHSIIITKHLIKHFNDQQSQLRKSIRSIARYKK